MADDFFRKQGIENMKKIEELIQRGKRGDEKAYQIAYKEIIKQIGHQPKNPKFKSQLVKLLTLMEKNREAKRYAEQFSREYPLDPVFILQRMDLSIKTGNIKQAEKMGDWLLEQDLVDSRILTTLRKAKTILGKPEEAIKEKLKNVKAQESKNEKARNNYFLRMKFYRKIKEMEIKLVKIDCDTLEGIDSENEIEEVRSFLVGSLENQILNHKESVANLEVLINSCMRTKKTQKALEILEELQKLESKLTEKERIRVAKIGSTIQSKKNRSRNIQLYYPEVIKKIKGNELKATDISVIKQKMNQFVSSDNHNIYKNIIMIQAYEALGWKGYQENEVHKAKRQIKTRHQEKVLDEVLQKKIELKENPKQEENGER